MLSASLNKTFPSFMINCLRAILPIVVGNKICYGVADLSQKWGGGGGGGEG